MNAQDAHRFVDEHDLADNVAAVARAAPELNAAQRAAFRSLLFQNARRRPAPETGWPPSPKPTAAPPAVNVPDRSRTALTRTEGDAERLLAVMDKDYRVEFEKAKRVIERRRGEMLGVDVTERQRTDQLSLASDSLDVSRQTISRWRTIARE